MSYSDEGETDGEDGDKVLEAMLARYQSGGDESAGHLSGVADDISDDHHRSISDLSDRNRDVSDGDLSDDDKELEALLKQWESTAHDESLLGLSRCPDPLREDLSDDASVDGRRLDGRRRQLRTDAQHSWLVRWRARISCWLVTSPYRQELQVCAHAIGLHLASRFDRALRLIRGHQPTGGSLTTGESFTGGGGGVARGGPMAGGVDPKCAWVADGERLQLPEFPELDGIFEAFGDGWMLPAIPALLPPQWEQSSVDEVRLQGAAVLGTRAHVSAVQGSAIGLGFVAGAALALGMFRTGSWWSHQRKRRSGIGVE